MASGAFYVRYPSTSGSANLSVGTNGATAPTSSTEVGGINPGGNLQPLQTDVSGNLLVNIGAATGAPFHVIVDSSALPSGASTSANQTTANTSLATIATNTGAVPQGNPAGNSPGSSTVSTVATLTAPANAVSFILMCLDTSTANIRWRIGAAATAASGQQLQPGRDTGVVPCGANVSICAESGTQAYDIQWLLRA